MVNPQMGGPSCERPNPTPVPQQRAYLANRHYRGATTGPSPLLPAKVTLLSTFNAVDLLKV